MPHRWLARSALDAARDELRRAASDPAVVAGAPGPADTDAARAEADRVFLCGEVLAVAAVVMGVVALAGIHRVLTVPWTAIAGSGAAIALFAGAVDRVRARRSPEVALALVVDVEGWGDAPRFGGARWYVTVERPNGRVVRLLVDEAQWRRFRVGAIGWTDVHMGRLRAFHTVVDADEVPSPRR